ncbi:MAG: diaminopimelate epimerase [Kineosporiaceae bacterium]
MTPLPDAVPAVVPEAAPAAAPEAVPVTLPETAVPTMSDGVPRLTKGHGTENDFVLVADPGAALHLDAGAVAQLCDRRGGLGADGLIRAVPTALVPEAAAMAEQAEWFMDYRNGDGSLAEMCGNGVRVFVAFLLREGLVTLAEGEVLSVATRAGVKTVRLLPSHEGAAWFAVGMGRWALVSGAQAAQAGHDALVHVRQSGVAMPGLRVDVGNPHVVVALPEDVDLASLDLTHEPVVEPRPDNGVNVELVRMLAVNALEGRLRMRVHERGSGETRSCGTGAVATVLAARAWLGEGAPTVWSVEVPGGRLRVALPPGSGVVSGEDVELAGPAVLLADVLPAPDWWGAVTS